MGKGSRRDQANHVLKATVGAVLALSVLTAVRDEIANQDHSAIQLVIVIVCRATATKHGRGCYALL